jgi:hypothetical protein
MGFYDLSHQSASVPGRERAARVMFALFPGVFLVLGFGIALEALYLGLHRPLDSLQVIVVAVVESGLVGGAAVCLFVFYKTGPGARAISVDQVGIVLEWSNGQRETLTWERPARTYVLLDYSETFTAPPQYRSLWELRVGSRPPTQLTEEAFRAILAKARSLGLSVESEWMPNPSFWLPCRATRINRRASESGQTGRV